MIMLVEFHIFSFSPNTPTLHSELTSTHVVFCSSGWRSHLGSPQKSLLGNPEWIIANSADVPAVGDPFNFEKVAAGAKQPRVEAD
jgi:hypothetical protein